MNLDGGRQTADRGGQKTEDRSRKTEDGEQRTIFESSNLQILELSNPPKAQMLLHKPVINRVQRFAGAGYGGVPPLIQAGAGDALNFVVEV